MTRFLHVPFLAWFAVVLLFAGGIYLALTGEWSPPEPRPYPHTSGVNVQRAVQLNTSVSAMALTVNDPVAWQQWCGEVPAQAEQFANAALAEGQERPGRAFAEVGSAVQQWCVNPANRAPVSTAVLAMFNATQPLSPQ